MKNHLLRMMALQIVFFAMPSFGMQMAYRYKPHRLMSSPSASKISHSTRTTNRLFSESLAFVKKNPELKDGDSLFDSISDKESIDLLQEKRLQAFLRLPSMQAKETILRQNKIIEDKLGQEVSDTLNNFAYGYLGGYISYDSWPGFRIIIKEHHEKRLESMKSANPNIKHDERLCGHWLQCVNTAMQLNGLDSRSVNLGLLEEERMGLGRNLVGAETNISYVKFFDSYKPYDNSVSILLNPKINAHWFAGSVIKNVRKHTAFHETTHVIKGHGQEARLFPAMIEEDRKISSQEASEIIKKDPRYYRYILACEREAECYAATKSAEAAHCARETMSIGNVCYLDAYAYIATLDTNWRALKKINQRTEDRKVPYPMIFVRSYSRQNA